MKKITMIYAIALAVLSGCTRENPEDGYQGGDFGMTFYSKDTMDITVTAEGVEKKVIGKDYIVVKFTPNELKKDVLHFNGGVINFSYCVTTKTKVEVSAYDYTADRSSNQIASKADTSFCSGPLVHNVE